MHLKVPGLCVTDVKSHFGHSSKTGSVPKEKQTLIDLLKARDLIKANAAMLRWMPNRHMLVDILTKKAAATPIVQKSLRENLYSAVPSREEELSEKAWLKLRSAQRQWRRDRKAKAKLAATDKGAA